MVIAIGKPIKPYSHGSLQWGLYLNIGTLLAHKFRPFISRVASTDKSVHSRGFISSHRVKIWLARKQCQNPGLSSILGNKHCMGNIVYNYWQPRQKCSLSLERLKKAQTQERNKKGARSQKGRERTRKMQFGWKSERKREAFASTYKTCRVYLIPSLVHTMPVNLHPKVQSRCSEQYSYHDIPFFHFPERERTHGLGHKAKNQFVGLLAGIRAGGKYS